MKKIVAIRVRKHCSNDEDGVTWTFTSIASGQIDVQNQAIVEDVAWVADASRHCWEGHLQMLNRWGEMITVDAPLKKSPLVQMMLGFIAGRTCWGRYRDEKWPKSTCYYSPGLQRFVTCFLTSVFIWTRKGRGQEALCQGIYRNHFEQILIILWITRSSIAPIAKSHIAVSASFTTVNRYSRFWWGGWVGRQAKGLPGRFTEVDKARSRQKGGGWASVLPEDGRQL